MAEEEKSLAQRVKEQMEQAAALLERIRIERERRQQQKGPTSPVR